jgi:hypothetical protein
LATGALVAVGPACGSSGSDVFVDDDGNPETKSVRFAHDGVLELEPREQIEVEILADPGVQVGLLLLGEAFDASIDRTTVRADATGHASIQLVAPSQPSTFRLRAQVGDLASAELPVAVSEGGFGKVRVVPEYDGARTVEGWVASVTVGTSCDAVLAGLPADPPGALVASSTVLEQPIVSSVPVGPSVAVMIRSGAVVAGCTMTTLEAAGTTVDVKVTALDRPMVLGGAELDLTLGFTTTDPAYANLLAGSTGLVTETAFPSMNTPAQNLLDAMAAELSDPTDLAALEDLRSTASLDATLDAQLMGFDPQATCSSLAEAAIVLAQTDAGTGTSFILGRLAGDASSPGAPLFELASFGGATPADLGVPGLVSMSWNATPGDGLVISGALPFSPSQHAAYWMNAAATAAAGVDATVADAIRAQLDCAAVAATIGSLQTCDTACLELVCGDAIDASWKRGALASDQGGFPPGLIKVTVSGAATVDDSAVPVTLEGAWVGSIQTESTTASASGSATGQAPPPG